MNKEVKLISVNDMGFAQYLRMMDVYINTMRNTPVDANVKKEAEKALTRTGVADNVGTVKKAIIEWD